MTRRQRCRSATTSPQRRRVEIPEIPLCPGNLSLVPGTRDGCDMPCLRSGNSMTKPIGAHGGQEGNQLVINYCAVIKVFCKSLLSNPPKAIQISQKFQILPNKSKRFRMQPRASVCIPAGLNASAWVQNCPKNFEKLRGSF